MELAILVPVLRRPQNVAPLLKSIYETTSHVDFDVIFLTSPGDTAEQQALIGFGHPEFTINANYEGRGDYARKINYAYTKVEADWYFLGADDLRFHPGWYDAARAIGTSVVGTNDLGNQRTVRGEHSTHSLVASDYVRDFGTIDCRGKILHEGYPHEYVDDEFVATAKRRRAWGFAKDSIVEHLHPNWGKAPMDSLYAAQGQRMAVGRQVYNRRKRLWMSR